MKLLSVVLLFAAPFSTISFGDYGERNDAVIYSVSTDSSVVNLAMTIEYPDRESLGPPDSYFPRSGRTIVIGSLDGTMHAQIKVERLKTGPKKWYFWTCFPLRDDQAECAENPNLNTPKELQ